jgi:1-phosphatidylinositol-3-phosphate 5-kinase
MLAASQVVDYSLLIGVNPATGTMAVGIIDYIRSFDVVKRLESRLKTVAQLATSVEPTVVEPVRYRLRLQAALDRYFVLVPNKWTDLHDNSMPAANAVTSSQVVHAVTEQSTERPADHEVGR